MKSSTPQRRTVALKSLWKTENFCRLLTLCAAFFLGVLTAHAEEQPISVLKFPTDTNKADAIGAIDAFKAGTAIYATDAITRKLPTRKALVELQVRQQLDDLFKTNEMIHRSLKNR